MNCSTADRPCPPHSVGPIPSQPSDAICLTTRLTVGPMARRRPASSASTSGVSRFEWYRELRSECLLLVG